LCNLQNQLHLLLLSMKNKGCWLATWLAVDANPGQGQQGSVSSYPNLMPFVM
jgi:hypothetical protein